MSLKKKSGSRFQQMVSILCVLSMLMSSMPYSMAFASVEAPTGEEPERTRSNHSTQINVSGPSNIRINTCSGNLFYPVSILTIPGRGLSIEISISYNSGWHDFATHYGHGWQLSYNMFYVRDESGDIIVVWEDGRADKFIKSNGSFFSPLDTYDTFQEYRPGKYLLRTKAGKEFYFDSSIHKRVTKIQDPNGNALNFAYDSDMLLTTISDASGRQVNFAYTNSNLTGITDNIGRSIHFQYDANGNLIGITDALGNTTLYGYDAEHFLTSITDPLGNSTAIAYSDGAVSNVTGALTRKSFSYDQVNRITTMTDVDPEGDQITRFFYDADDRINRIEYVKDSEGNVIFRGFNWDEKNNLIGFTDENGNTIIYTYDTMGNILSVTDALGRTQYVYENTCNRLTSVTNANGHTTIYEYDSHGNLIREKDPLGNSTSYTYKGDGELLSKTDANGAITTYSYDDYGNLISETDPFGNNISYSYDDVGNMTAMTSADASLLYTYDDLNHVTNVSYASHGKSISYTYDAMANRKSMTDIDGGITSYAYDEANRLISLTNPLGRATSYSYDSRGRLIRREYHNGTYATYQYDRLNRLISLINKKFSGEVISSYTYEHDNAGNRTKMTEANGEETIYDYDNLYQLTNVTYPDNSTAEYAYDAVGNRLTLTDTTGTTDYSCDAADRLLTAGTVTYGWDKNGNMISKTDGSNTTIYAYDYKNRLISTAFPDGKTNTFGYYPDSRRMRLTDKAGLTTYYFYDGFNVFAETNASGTTVARYTSAGIDNWISMDRGGSSYYYHYDGLGSVTGLTSSGEAVVATYEYDVFGAMKNQTGSVVNPYRFTGREYDEESGLYYYRARYYGPSLGRFLSPDPIGFAGGINLYTYVQNNSVNLADPLGLEELKPPVYPWPTPDPFPEPWPPWWPTPTPSPTPSPPPSPGTGGGGTGGSGIESMPLMNIRPSYFRQPNLCKPNKANISASITEFLDIISNLFLAKEAFAGPTSEQGQPDSLVSLADIIPTKGPAGTEAIPITPSGPFEVNSNAVDAAAMDFVDTKTSLNKATVYATKTISRTYNHDYPLCNRFHDYTLETTVAIPLPGALSGTTDIPWFWYISMTKDDLVEEGFIFSVFIDEDAKTFTVDSHWLSDQYPAPEAPDYDYVFNFQIWSSSSEEAYKLVRRTLTNLSNFEQDWRVIFANTEEPVAPAVLIKSVELICDTVRIKVQSWLPQTQTVSFCGFMRYPSDRENNVPFEHGVTLEPGFNIVELPLGNILDALIHIQVNDFTDRVYVGTGSWFSFADSGGYSETTLTLPNCAETTNLTSSDFVLAGCAGITGRVDVNGWAGMARTLNPNDLPIDVSQYQALTFFARGDGKSYRVSIETDSVRQLDSSDFHQFVFTTSSEWRQFVIPLSYFSQRGWDPTKIVPFTGEDVVSIAWASVVGPLESINLEVDGVAFINSTLISETSVLPDTNDVAGPYTVTTQVTDDTGIQAVYLFYSLDGGETFTSVPMNENGNSYSASIPGQPLGVEVWYYIEATDIDGNVATDPVDIPYRFQVSEHPYLLVDDFADTDPLNVLDGDSGPYGSDSGSSILVHHDEDYVWLDYDVSATSSYAGYYSLLKGANLTPYNAVTFMIKGATGGEKARVGLRDNSLNETKIVIGEYLPGGITTSWQRVTIPLVAFTRVTDCSGMENFNVDFENRIDSGTGTIYLDDIKFEYIPLVPVVVDNFNDMTGENGLGGSLWAWSGGGASINTAYDQTNRLGDSGAGYRISYSNVTSSAWALAVMDLTGLDASNYETVSFYIKGADGGEQPNIYLVSKKGDTEMRGFVDIEDYITVTTPWKRVNIPLEAFDDQGVDLSNLAYFQLGFEWEEMAGTIYLDNYKNRLHDYDTDGDGDVDGLDLVIYIETHEDFSDLSSFATVFGTRY